MSSHQLDKELQKLYAVDQGQLALRLLRSVSTASAREPASSKERPLASQMCILFAGFLGGVPNMMGLLDMQICRSIAMAPQNWSPSKRYWIGTPMTFCTHFSQLSGRSTP